MKNRVGHMLGANIRRDALASDFSRDLRLSMLRRHAELVGLKIELYTFWNTDEPAAPAKQLIKAEGVDDKRWPARLLAGVIDGLEKKRAL